MPRPTKFSKETAFSILESLRAGNSQEVAAQVSGINPATFYNWQKKATSGNKEMVEFFEDVKKAKAEAESRNVRIITEAAEKSWQAAAWWLERRNPEHWARREDYKRVEDKPTAIEVIIKGEDEPDDKRTESPKNIQSTSSTT